MTNSKKKFTKKFILLASLGPLIPLLMIAVAFFAVKSDAKNKAEYDRIRAEQAARIEAKEKQKLIEQQSSTEVNSSQP
jgi:hypothetical protein